MGSPGRTLVDRLALGGACAFDVLVVSAVIWLLVGRSGSLGLGPAARAWTAFAIFLCYFSTTEWVHCQRDTWMLPAALIAVRLRQRQWRRLTAPNSARSVLLPAVAEGLCWGAAFWIKPFVAVPALSCWLLTVLFVYRQRSPSSVRDLLLDATGMLGGGLLVGGVGMLWLWHSGAWPYLWNILTGFDQEYLDTSQKIPFISRLLLLYNRLWPWGLVHFAAVPVSLGLIARALVQSSSPVSADALLSLLAAFYLGWLLQALCLQLPHDYVLTPPTLLGMTVAASGIHTLAGPRVRWLALAVFAVIVVIYHPLRRLNRLEVWGRCWTEGSSSDIRNRLTLVYSTHTPDWVELHEVAEYLRSLHLRDWELTCFTPSVTAPLPRPRSEAIDPSLALRIFFLALQESPGRDEPGTERQPAALRRDRPRVSVIEIGQEFRPLVSRIVVSADGISSLVGQSISLVGADRLSDQSLPRPPGHGAGWGIGSGTRRDEINDRL